MWKKRLHQLETADIAPLDLVKQKHAVIDYGTVAKRIYSRNLQNCH